MLSVAHLSIIEQWYTEVTFALKGDVYDKCDIMACAMVKKACHSSYA